MVIDPFGHDCHQMARGKASCAYSGLCMVWLSTQPLSFLISCAFYGKQLLLVGTRIQLCI